MNTFVSQTILTRLHALTQEIKGVRRNKDIEYIHRMRVASRRLRTALNLFEDSLPKNKWRQQIKKLAAALGEARDTDVQIEFLKQTLARAEPRHRPGLRRLLLRLKQRRAGLQDAVAKALDKFEKKNVPGHLIDSLSVSQADADSSRQPPIDILATLSTGVQEVLTFDSLIRDPAHINELHALRIACKHLRYTLEILTPLWTPTSPDADLQLAEVGVQPYLRIVKTFQEILGDIHDCDVWMELVPQFLKDEEQRTFKYFGHARSLRTLEPGLHYLRDERAYQRTIRYHEFLDLWQTHLDLGTWRDLLTHTHVIPSPLQAQVSPAPPAQIECIALIGDIHANLPALEAVLAHARAHGAQAIWNVGDLVGYGPYPDEVAILLKHESATSISGNYDLKVLQVKQKKEKWKKTKQPEKLLAFEWAYDHLSKESRDYIRALPPEHRLSLHGKRILLTHGSPDSNEEALTSDTPEKRLRELAHKSNADIIIFGHSHQPFAKQVDGVWLINTGSVGRPDDGDPRAAYALLRLAPESLQVEHHRIAYDTQRIAAAIRNHGLPDSFARIFLHGRSLDDLVIEE